MLNKKFYCSLSSFYAILNRVLSNISNMRVTVFSVTRSENVHILCYVCILSSVEPKKKHFRMLNKKFYCLLFSFFSISNRVSSKISNIKITVFSFTRSKNVHILCNVCILSSVEPKKVNFAKNLKIVFAFSYVKQEVLLFAFILLCYIKSCIIKHIKYASNCF